MSNEVELKQVIVTRLLRRGSGRGESSPIRIITQYWSMDGELLVEIDPFSTTTAIEDRAAKEPKS